MHALNCEIILVKLIFCVSLVRGLIFLFFFLCSRSLRDSKKKKGISKNSEKKNRQISWEKKKRKIGPPKKQNLSRPSHKCIHN